jgi:hypothetical protein
LLSLREPLGCLQQRVSSDNGIMKKKKKTKTKRRKLRGKALFRKALNHIIAVPEEYRQSVWVQQTGCGTVRCIGGWIDYFAEVKYLHEFDYDFGATGKLIGVSHETATWLFHGNRSLLTIYFFAEAFLGGKKKFTIADLRRYDRMAVKPL